MNGNEIISAIGSVGFPIVAFFMLLYYQKSVMVQLIEAVNNNSKIISKLVKILNKGKEIDDE